MWLIREDFTGDVFALLHCFQSLNIAFKKIMVVPWLIWLGGLGASLQTERSPVRFPARAHAWDMDQVLLSWGCGRGSRSMYLSHMDVSLPLFLPPFPSLKVNK